MTLSEGYKEDLRNHYNDGYRFGYEQGKKDGEQKGAIDTRIKIYTLVDLDMLIPDNVKGRIKDLIRGGTDESRTS